MKQANDAAKQNDLVIRQAQKDGRPIFIKVHKDSAVVVTGMNTRPLYYDADMAAESNHPAHRFVTVDYRDPLADVFLEETPQGHDRWVYRPMMTVEIATGDVEVVAIQQEAKLSAAAGPSPEDVATAVEQFQRELSSPEMSAELGKFWDEEAAAQETPVLASPVNPGKPHIIARHSELVDAASCLYAYNLKWIKNLRPKRTDAKLSVGSLFHAFQEVYEKALADYTGEQYLMPLEFGLFALDEMARKFHDAIPENDPQARMDFMEKCWRFAKDICNNYHAWRIADPVGKGLSAIREPEATFTLKIGEIDGVAVHLSGTMDGVGVTRETPGATTDDYWLREYKTCASIADKLKTYRIDKQTRRYVGAMRQQGIDFMGVELVLAAKTLPLADEDFILKSKGKEGYISRDKDKWSKANHAQALRIRDLGKLDEPDGKKGLTEQGFHDILKTLEDKPNQFFHVERLYFNEHELDVVMEETLVEAHRLHVTRETATQVGDKVFTRNPGPMNWNCKCCSVRDLCEMDLKGVDTAFQISEFYTVDGSIHAGKEIDDADD